MLTKMRMIASWLCKCWALQAGPATACIVTRCRPRGCPQQHDCGCRAVPAASPLPVPGHAVMDSVTGSRPCRAVVSSPGHKFARA